MIRLILGSGDYITARVGGKIVRLDSYEKSDSMISTLFRYEMMKKAGVPDSSNPHAEDMKLAFAPFGGVYVMSIFTADTLAKTGRKMDVVCVYDYQDIIAVIRRYNNRGSKL